MNYGLWIVLMKLKYFVNKTFEDPLCGGSSSSRGLARKFGKMYFPDSLHFHSLWGNPGKVVNTDLPTRMSTPGGEGFVWVLFTGVCPVPQTAQA